MLKVTRYPLLPAIIKVSLFLPTLACQRSCREFRSTLRMSGAARGEEVESVDGAVSADITSREFKDSRWNTGCEYSSTSPEIEGEQLDSWVSPDPTHKEEKHPSLYCSNFSTSKRSRIMTVDPNDCVGQRLNMAGEKRSKQAKIPTVSELDSENNELSLPTRFGKQDAPSPSSKVAKTRSAARRPGRENSISQGQPISESFDICLPQISKPISPEYAVLKESKIGKVDNPCQMMEAGKLLRPGMVLYRNYLSLDEQITIVKICQDLGLRSGGFYQPVFRNGAKLHFQMMCLGLDWDPQTRRYGKKRAHDDSEPPSIPCFFMRLVSKGLVDSQNLLKRKFGASNVQKILPGMTPDICIVNFYMSHGRLGLHQDRDESSESLEKGLPVVSLSIGDSAEFLYGDERNIDKAERVALGSGDMLVFGGQSRHIFHGVASILPNTAPSGLLDKTGLRPGRLNLTFRKY